jgi:hypothetical protein
VQSLAACYAPNDFMALILQLLNQWCSLALLFRLGGEVKEFAGLSLLDALEKLLEIFPVCPMSEHSHNIWGLILIQVCVLTCPAFSELCEGKIEAVSFLFHVIAHANLF